MGVFSEKISFFWKTAVSFFIFFTKIRFPSYNTLSTKYERMDEFENRCFEISQNSFSSSQKAFPCKKIICLRANWSSKIEYCKSPNGYGGLTETSSRPIYFHLFSWYNEIKYQRKISLQSLFFKQKIRFLKEQQKIFKNSGENIMKYFVNEKERKASGSTCYFEFQKGFYQNKSWLEDSVCLHADLFDELRLFRLFSDSLGTFDYYGPTNVVNKEKWDMIVEKSKENESWKSVIDELKPWVEDCFIRYHHFTICGI